MQLMVIHSQEFLRARDQSAEDLRWEPRLFFSGSHGKKWRKPPVIDKKKPVKMEIDVVKTMP